MTALKGIFQLTRLCFFSGLLFSVSLTAQAAYLNLNMQLPDISTSFINTSYDAGTEMFDVTYSVASTLSTDGITQNDITDGTLGFNLNAKILNGGIFDSGTFSVTGTVASLGFNSGTLISGNLSALGYANDSSQLLEFLFTPTGGDLLSLYNGRNGGIIFSVSGYDGGDFNSSFTNAAYNGFATIAPVPVPAAVWLFGSGLLALAGIARRRA